MRLDNINTISTIAENEVNNICTGDFTQVVLPQFSKEPSYDGKLYYYPNSTLTKKDLIQIDIQVKGTKDDNNNSFYFDMVDLENYMNNNGVILFVVKIDKDYKDNNKKRILVKSLLPTDIKKIIKGKEHQKGLTLKLKQIFDNDQLIFLCREFSIMRTDKNIGSPFINNMTNLKSEVIKEFSWFKRLDGNYHISLKTNDNRYYIENIEKLSMEGNFKIPVISNEEIYFDQVEVKQDESLIYKLSDNLSIEFKTNNTWNLNFGINDKLSNVINNLEFLISIKNDTFYIGENSIVLQGISLDKNNPFLDYYIGVKKIYDYLKASNNDIDINLFLLTENEQIRISNEATRWYEKST